MSHTDQAPAVGWDVESVAAELLRCEDERTDRPPFTDEWPGLDLDTGYRVQDLALEQRLARGERLVGVKLGLTSKAKQERMGVDVPLVAWLTDAMVLPEGSPVPQDRLIHPRVEPEIVFVMRDRLEGPGVDVGTAMAAVGSVCAGAEVMSSPRSVTVPDRIGMSPNRALSRVDLPAPFGPMMPTSSPS